MDQDRPPPRRASNRSCVAHRRADLPETGLRSSQRVLARTTDVSASSLPEATLPTMQASLQSTLHAPTIFESWLPMDSDIFRKGNCNDRRKPAIELDKEPAIMVREPDATRQPTPHDIQLMSKRRVLSFKPQLRLEWRGQDGQNETEQPDHSASLGDSITASTRIRFSVHTPRYGYTRDGARSARRCGPWSKAL